MTIAEDKTPLFTVRVDGIEWASRTENADRFWCRAPGLGFFAIAKYGKGGRIFKGWCALETGCGIGVKDVGSATEAMKQVAPHIRKRAKEIEQRERAHLTQAEEAVKAVGA